jgi:transcriptional regulator with XRE-family HTH domain
MSHDSHFGHHLDQAIKDVARLYVGVGRRFSQCVLADATGIPPSTLKSYLSGHASISGENLLKLIAVLPPEAGNMLIRSCGYRLHPMETDEGTWDVIGSEAAGLCSEIFEAKSDGRIDHVEAASLKKRCQKLVAKLDGVA